MHFSIKKINHSIFNVVQTIFSNLKIDIRLLKNLDFGILLTSVFLVCFGILNIYLSTYGKYGTLFVSKQINAFILSLIVLYLVLTINYLSLKRCCYIFYWLCVALLVYTKFRGVTINGATGWIKIPGLFSIEPSEFARIAIIMVIGSKLDNSDFEINNIKNLVILAIYTLIPMVLILVQPALGMAALCLFVVIGILYVSGLNFKIFGTGFLIAAVVLTLGWNSGLIKDYQKKRVMDLVSPENNELTTGYQLNQAKIGVGSGGPLGTGIVIRDGKPLGYVSSNVPECQTDFIFSVIGETFGTVGSTILISVYGFLIYRIIRISKNAKDKFGMVFCVGIACYLIFAIFQNIGMNVGILPISGITLPLISYGGSSLMTTMFSLAIILNIGMRRNKLQF